MTDKCPRCPIAGECHAFAATCDAIAASDVARDEFARLAPSYRGDCGSGDVAPAPSGGSPPTYTVAESTRLLVLMRACPDRDERTDCGCGGLARCAKGRGSGGLVNHFDCMACLRESDG